MDSGNDFTVQVKGNTPTLLASLETTITTTTHKDTHIIEKKRMVSTFSKLVCIKR